MISCVYCEHAYPRLPGRCLENEKKKKKKQKKKKKKKNNKTKQNKQTNKSKTVSTVAPFNKIRKSKINRKLGRHNTFIYYDVMTYD